MEPCIHGCPPFPLPSHAHCPSHSISSHFHPPCLPHSFLPTSTTHLTSYMHGHCPYSIMPIFPFLPRSHLSRLLLLIFLTTLLSLNFPILISFLTTFSLSTPHHIPISFQMPFKPIPFNISLIHFFHSLPCVSFSHSSSCMHGHLTYPFPSLNTYLGSFPSFLSRT